MYLFRFNIKTFFFAKEKKKSMLIINDENNKIELTWILDFTYLTLSNDTHSFSSSSSKIRSLFHQLYYRMVCGDETFKFTEISHTQRQTESSFFFKFSL